MLFRLASTFTDDEATCAAGACGVQSYATLCVDNSGQVRPKPERAGEASPFNAWNVDATQIVFEHSDIYKGRVASLLAALVFDDEQKRRFPTQSSGEDTELRCAWMQTERD